ncbi:hypothetical protein A3A46_01260 [Candidatus Roizmanbacteria bacterium RIFCSPLOWO2_01_FULL_37_13]|uniref:Uncharacterized protein n=1 Tax=Candidatus Roizmanbacteria bacterium RIFCSPHIGHO2_02_FULL_38_11 TaxID=1802039 RepID=A0A1F7H0K5_9BACT|nr:MAG: hypothetical protein A3C25_01560 [Candidatus Roizmanbacteria bacterium RIFCSPHIGHO2_02_FULL_38_11]OGK33757.1 MAG: hypothetical protein A3F58_01095 [Candidatus Roizmanbacteria bacterium RIFCSPHIGHO2_12_FULL_37_9b]OGK42498.1 MAG: hypothetical protein A3A46_01260 [Candidatus Roizmanbacteria bacterium RIFCSPLOWO2_01_FULL_37_13]
MKTIVTHFSPDLDAISSCWLIKKFLPGWQNALIKFVPAGSTLNNLPPDDNPEIIHVDTGLGKFDHHQTNIKTCSAEKILDYLKKNGLIKMKLLEPLTRLVSFVIEDDHFLEVYYPEPEADRYEFLLNNTIDGVKIVLAEDQKLAEFVFVILDGTLEKFKKKIAAEEETKKGLIFQSYLGKSFAVESPNDEVLRFAQKIGYQLVIRKDPKFGNIRIKCPPEPKLDLTPIYNKILKIDSIGSWFLHSSKHMLLNGSPKRPDQIPSPLSIRQIIEIVKSV